MISRDIRVPLAPYPRNSLKMDQRWGWGGISVDPTGRWLYAGTANAHVPDADCGCVLETAGHGEKVLRLLPKLKVIVTEGDRY